MVVMERKAHPFTIDCNVRFVVNVIARHLWDIFSMFHVRGITTCAKNTGYLGPWVHVVRCNQGSRCVVD